MLHQTDPQTDPPTNRCAIGSGYVGAPFGLGYAGGVAVARGDVNREGTNDVLVVSSPARGVRDDTTRDVVVSVAVAEIGADWAAGPVMRQLRPFRSGYAGGVRLGVGNVNRDGTDDLVVGPGDFERWVRIYDSATLPGAGEPPLRDTLALQDRGPLFTQSAWSAEGHGVRVAFAGVSDRTGAPDRVISGAGTRKSVRFRPTNRSTTTERNAGAAAPLAPMPCVPSGIYVG